MCVRSKHSPGLDASWRQLAASEDVVCEVVHEGGDASHVHTHRQLVGDSWPQSCHVKRRMHVILGVTGTVALRQPRGA